MPADIGACATTDLAGDMVALVAALGELRAGIVGGDRRMNMAWSGALLRPEHFTQARPAEAKPALLRFLAVDDPSRLGHSTANRESPGQ